MSSRAPRQIPFAITPCNPSPVLWQALLTRNGRVSDSGSEDVELGWLHVSTAERRMSGTHLAKRSQRVERVG